MGTVEGFFLVFVFDSGTLAERRGFRLPGLGDLRWEGSGRFQESWDWCEKVALGFEKNETSSFVPRTCNKTRFQFVINHFAVETRPSV